MSYAVVTLKKGEGRTLKAGGAWIFDNEIESITGGFDNGSIVLVHDFDGYPMGRGFINQNSKIRVRMMTRNIHQDIDESFLRMRVKNAWEYRKTIVDTSSCRLIFGEADFLPGLVIDNKPAITQVDIDKVGDYLIYLVRDPLGAYGKDPAERMAERLENAECIGNSGMFLSYTGYYKGAKVTCVSGGAG